MKVLYYACVRMWRVILGRWFVWRDAPTDVVRAVAATWRWVRNHDQSATKELVRQARDEAKLRGRRK